MPTSDAARRRVQRFRITVAVVVALPWVFLGAVAPFADRWPLSAGSTIAQLTVDALLVTFAWRRPWGFATWLILLRTIGAGLLVLAMTTTDLGAAFGAAEVIGGLGLLAMFLTMWSDLRRDHTEARDFARSTGTTVREARDALRRRERIERRGRP